MSKESSKKQQPVVPWRLATVGLGLGLLMVGMAARFAPELGPRFGLKPDAAADAKSYSDWILGAAAVVGATVLVWAAAAALTRRDPNRLAARVERAARKAANDRAGGRQGPPPGVGEPSTTPRPKTARRWPWRTMVTLGVVAAAAIAVGLWAPTESAPDTASTDGSSGAMDGAVRTAAEWSLPVLIGALGLLVVVVAATVVLARRRTQSARVTEAVIGRIRSPLLTRDPVSVARYPWGRPRLVRVKLPADFASDDVKERKALEHAVTLVLGGDWRGDWNPHRLRRGRLSIRPRKGPDTQSEEQPRTDRSRLSAVMVKPLGKDATIKQLRLDENGRAQEFVIEYPPNASLAIPGYRARVEASLTGIFPGLWEVRWDLVADKVSGHRRPVLDGTVPYQWSPVTDATALKLPVAAVAGREWPAVWDLDGKTPHGLITGETGGGKTYAFLVLALEALRRGIPVFGLDPKRIELMTLEGWPGLERLGTDAAAMAEIIEYLHDVMMYRYKLIESRQLRRRDLWPIVVFADELLILTRLLNEEWAHHKAENRTKGGKDHPALAKLGSLIVLARSARIHMCFGVQRPQATLFDEGTRDSVRFRLSLGRLSQEGAIQMWNSAAIGVDVPADVAGRGTVSTPEGPMEAQVFKLPEMDTFLTPDEELSPEDRELRQRLWAECRDAVQRRPTELHMSIGGYQSASAKFVKEPSPAAPQVVDGTAAAVTEWTPIPSKNLAVDMRVLVDGEDGADQVEAHVVGIDTEDDDGQERVLVSYRCVSDGREGELDLDPDDELQLAHATSD